MKTYFAETGVLVCRTDDRPMIKDFDGLDKPDRSLIDYEKYNHFIGQSFVKHSMSLQATRGCPYKCVYCHKIWPKKHVIRSAENIFEEVKTLYDIGVRRFSFIDDIFNLNKKNSSRFFEMVIKNKLDIQLFFPNGMRGDILTKEYIDLMIEAGTKDISLALETASPRLQKLIKKNLKVDKLYENCSYIAEKYPDTILRIFTMIGFPTETEEEAMMTVDFLKSIKWIYWPIRSILKIFPNTEMEELAIANGISKSDILESSKLAYHSSPLTLPFSKNVLIKIQQEFYYDYFISKERLLTVLPNQLKFYTEEEIIQQYNAYLAKEFKTFKELITFLNLSLKDIGVKDIITKEKMYIPDLNKKIKKVYPQKRKNKTALRILLLDLSLLFSNAGDSFNGVSEAPLGLMLLLTYLNKQMGRKINGKIAKSNIDFDNFDELKVLIDDFEPDIIGVRTLSIYKEFFHESISKMREFGINVPIIAGGPYSTSEFKSVLKDKNIDLVVLGEGEVTFSHLITEIIENENKLPGIDVLKNIPGISFRSDVPDEETEIRTILQNMIDGDFTVDDVEKIFGGNYEL